MAPPSARGASHLRYPVFRIPPSRSWRALVGAALVVAGCGSAEPERPDLLIVTFDTTRYDRVGFNGDASARTPNVDALAARGLVFDRAYAAAPITLPSHTTMMTGLEPVAHGVHNNGSFKVPDEIETLAERLGAAGYETAAFVSARVLHSSYNLDQGFDEYGDKTAPKGAGKLNFGVPQRPADEVVDDALAWMRARSGERPFFVWAHFYDPHTPRKATAPFLGMLDVYEAEIAFADQEFGRLLDGARRLARSGGTFVVFTADHGESFGEHGEDTHATIAYDSTLHVPLVLAGPGVPDGERSEILVRHSDLVPTILPALGLEAPDDLPGRDILAAARMGAEDDETIGYFECLLPHDNLGWAPIHGVRSRRWKYTAVPNPPELYDVLADSGELDNLAGKHPEVESSLAAAHAALLEEWGEPGDGARVEEVDEDELQRLAALGYVEARSSYERGEEPDPRRYARANSWVSRARSEAVAGNYRSAIHTLEALAESPALRALVLRTLGPIYSEAGRFDDAIRVFEADLEATGSKTAAIRLAEVYLGLGEPERTLDILEDPGDGYPKRAWVIRARALYALGRVKQAREEIDTAYADQPARARRLRASLVIESDAPDAERELRQLLAASPSDAVVMSQLGLQLASRGRLDQAEEALGLLRRAAEGAPGHAQPQSNHGWGAYKLGHHEEAVRALEEALRIDPSRSEDRARLAYALSKVGRQEQARSMLRRTLKRRPGAPWADEARAFLNGLEADVAAEEGGDA